jgi:hypothetical protein
MRIYVHLGALNANHNLYLITLGHFYLHSVSFSLSLSLGAAAAANSINGLIEKFL